MASQRLRSKQFLHLCGMAFVGLEIEVYSCVIDYTITAVSSPAERNSWIDIHSLHMVHAPAFVLTSASSRLAIMELLIAPVAIKATSIYAPDTVSIMPGGGDREEGREL